jgi:hypothetical protein
MGLQNLTATVISEQEGREQEISLMTTVEDSGRLVSARFISKDGSEFTELYRREYEQSMTHMQRLRDGLGLLQEIKRKVDALIVRVQQGLKEQSV